VDVNGASLIPAPAHPHRWAVTTTAGVPPQSRPAGYSNR
jgi:hypothetical protein